MTRTETLEPAEAGGATQTATPRGRHEFLATLFMAVAAVLTAWSAFQSAKWSGVQAIAFNQASAARVESTRESTLAGQQATIDVITFTQWLQALQQEQSSEPTARAESESREYVPDQHRLSGFLFLRLRPEFRPAVLAWLALNPERDAAAPATPFEMPQYHLAATERAAAQERQAEDYGRQARQANQRSDNYVLTSVAFATVLFFAGISTQLRRRRSRSVALVLAVLVLTGATVTIATFPVQL